MLFFNQDSRGLRVTYPDPAFPVICRLVTFPGIADNCRQTCWHEDVVLIQNLTKPLVFRVYTDDVVLEAGDILLVNSAQLHSCRSDDPAGCFRAFLFHPELLRGLLESDHPFYRRIEDRGLRFVRWPACSRQAQILRPLLECVDEQGTADAARRLEMISLACLSAAFFCDAPASVSAAAHRERRDEDAVRAMLACLVRSYGEKLSLDLIAEEAGVSRSKCCKLFGALVGTTPMDYLSGLRLGIAAWMLSHTDLSIRVIAQRCGFPEQSYFTRLFKARYHCTPGRCRKSADESKKTA